MTLASYLRTLRERWRVILVFVLLSVAVALAATSLTPRTYEATVQVFVTSTDTGSSQAAYNGVAFLQSQVPTYAEIVGSPRVLNAVRSDLSGLSLTNQELKAKITADVPSQKTLVNIHLTDSSPAEAARLANSVGRAFVTAIEGYETSIKKDGPTVRLYITAPATAPSSPVSPNATLNIALGLLLGILVGVSIAVLREALDRRVVSLDALAKAAEAPPMGVVVNDPRAQRHPIAVRAGARNVRAENFRQLRANLQFANVDVHPRIIAVTSSVPEEGKSMVALNLASTLAEAGFTVALVDADLRRPTIAKSLGLVGVSGLTSVLVNQLPLAEALQPAGLNLFVLTSGPTPPNPSEVLASAYVRETMQKLLEMVDYVIIDTAPLLPVADGAEVASLADGTLLVARYKMTLDSQIARSAGTLRRVNARPIGVVLNRIPSKRSSEYGYTYYSNRLNPSDPQAEQHKPTGLLRRRVKAGDGASAR